MPETTELTLAGLEADNLLAFLAMLGLLRALEAERPAWNARVAWSLLPTRANLFITEDVSPSDVAAAASDGCRRLAQVHHFDARDIAFSREEARDALQEAARQGGARALLLSALVSDGVMKSGIKSGEVQPSPICTMFGQGHQHFLDRLKAVPLGSPGTGSSRKPVDLGAPSFIEKSLFRPWERADATDGFRWDPLDDRRYAVRYDDPSSSPATTEHGANRLAAVAVPLLTAFPGRRAGRPALVVRGFSWGKDGPRFTWPIWTRPAPLATILALLDHPELAQETPRMRRLGSLSIVDVRRSRRFSVGKFLNFSRAESVVAT
jgi:hypothetical protein